jgi:hypothetical protein
LVLERARDVLVLECKLQNYEEACVQLEGLYLPVLSMFYAKPVRGLVVAKYLTHNSPLERVFPCLSDALASPAGTFPIIHWLGRGPF